MIIIRMKSFNDYVLQMYISEITAQNNKIRKTLNIFDRALDCDVLDFRIIQIRFSTMFIVHINTRTPSHLFPFSSSAYEVHTIYFIFCSHKCLVFSNPCYALHLHSLLNFFLSSHSYLRLLSFGFQCGRKKSFKHPIEPSLPKSHNQICEEN